jgi:uncharacterized membrane protein HdeD (DUF308 family)
MTDYSASNDTDVFGLDAKTLGRSAINGIRVAFGIMGVVAVILGVVLLVWPVKTAAVFTVALGIYFLVVGVVRLGLGIFSRGIGGWERAFDIFLGILLVILGIFALRNVTASSAALLFLIVTIIGIGWILEGVFAIVQSGSSGARGWAITFGIISIVAGILVLVTPGWSVALLILFGGIVLVILGVVGIVRAFTFGRDVLKSLS